MRYTFCCEGPVVDIRPVKGDGGLSYLTVKSGEGPANFRCGEGLLRGLLKGDLVRVEGNMVGVTFGASFSFRPDVESVGKADLLPGAQAGKRPAAT